MWVCGAGVLTTEAGNMTCESSLLLFYNGIGICWSQYNVNVCVTFFYCW